MVFYSNSVNKFIFLAILLGVGETNCFSQNNQYDPHSDTITIGNVIGNFKPPSHIDFTFDPICIELYLDEPRLAIVPANLIQFIDKTRISRRDQESETLSDGRNLLRIRMFVVTK
ncbi:MAG TPA: hypothetical protein VK517_00715 [Cyclobacteriaceae bacterium]|nr:hypothetical protein [Cyclobacteriaceae bacterium]